MKIRNDFVTNSSSMISLWKDFKMEMSEIKNPSDDGVKLCYNEKITLYSGYPHDLQMRETDLQTLLNDSSIPLADFRFVFQTLSLPIILERFALSSIYIDYINETHAYIKISVKQNENTGKRYISFELPDRIFGFDLESYSEIFETDINAAWGNLPHTEIEHKNRPPEYMTRKRGTPPIDTEEGDFDDNYFCDISYHYDESQVIRSVWLEDLAPADYYYFTMYFSRMLLSDIENGLAPTFGTWLASKFGGLKAELNLQARGLCAEDTLLGEFDSDNHNYISGAIIDIKKTTPTN